MSVSIGCNLLLGSSPPQIRSWKRETLEVPFKVKRPSPAPARRWDPWLYFENRWSTGFLQISCKFFFPQSCRRHEKLEILFKSSVDSIVLGNLENSQLKIRSWRKTAPPEAFGGKIGWVWCLFFLKRNTLKARPERAHETQCLAERNNPVLGTQGV